MHQRGGAGAVWGRARGRFGTLVLAFGLSAAGPRSARGSAAGGDGPTPPARHAREGTPVTDPDTIAALKKAAASGKAPPKPPQAGTYMGQPIAGRTPTVLEAAIRESKCVQKHFALAVAGSPYHQDELGHCFYFGYEGTPIDLGEGLKWHRKAAAAGQVTGQFWVGHSLFTGRGVAADFEIAAVWYRRAATQGHAKAQHNLGYLYEHGHGVPVDHAAAVQWQRRAAMQGEQWAQRSLADLYAGGLGPLEQDNTVAYAWYLLASTGDDDEPRLAAASAMRELECDAACQTEAAALTARLEAQIAGEPRDCRLTDWLEAGECKRIDGECVAKVARHLVHPSAHGGADCSNETLGRRACPEADCRKEL